MAAEQWFVSVVSGERKGIAASLARGILAAGEPVYTAGIHARNFLYTRRMLHADHARRPVISVGNITTGGTGKTPVVAWLVQQLREAGRTPAVLLRGYKSGVGGSDEELLLRELIAPSPVKAHANRFAGSEAVLAEHPEVDAFVLDDGLQHRKLARYFSLVLVDATQPFGYGRVLPRGLLREPMRGLRRASAVLITRADLVDEQALKEIERQVRSQQAEVPVFRCVLKQDRIISSGGEEREIEGLKAERIFAFCGIGNPSAFFQQVENASGQSVGRRAFADHHPYSLSEVSILLDEARKLGATALVTTQKDWVKIAPMAQQLPKDLPILRIGLSVQIENPARLVELAMAGIHEGDRLLGWRTP